MVGSKLLRTNAAKLATYDPETANLTPKELKEKRSKNYDYLKDYLLDLRISESNYIVGDDDDDGYIDNEIEDVYNNISENGVEMYEDEVHESDYLSTSISQDSSDNESAVDLLSEYFASKIAVKMGYDSLREEMDSGEVINEETGLIMKKQQSILNGFAQSQYKKNLFQKISNDSELTSSYCADDDMLVSEKSTSERTIDAFILPKAGFSNNITNTDYHNTATLTRRTNEDALSVLPRIKWGSLKKLYLYQFNNNDRYVSALGSTKISENTDRGEIQISIPPLSQYTFDNGYSLDTTSHGGNSIGGNLDKTSNLIVNSNKSAYPVWYGLESSWFNKTNSTVAPIKILKSDYVDLDINRVESHAEIPLATSAFPIV